MWPSGAQSSPCSRVYDDVFVMNASSDDDDDDDAEGGGCSPRGPTTEPLGRGGTRTLLKLLLACGAAVALIWCGGTGGAVAPAPRRLPSGSAGLATGFAAALQGLAEEPQRCALLWPFNVSQMVARGVGYMSTYFVNAAFMIEGHDGCDILMPETTAEEWKTWGLKPLGTSVPPATFRDLWAHGEKFQMAGKKIMKRKWHVNGHTFNLWLKGVGLTFKKEEEEYAQWKNKAEHLDWFIGMLKDLTCSGRWGDLMLETYQPRLDAYEKPYTTPYAAVHVRHGDKAMLEKVSSLGQIMDGLRANWSSTHQVFIATDDANVLKGSSLDAYRKEGLHFRWTDGHRWPGGEKAHTLHESNEGALTAVLGDIMGLAHASVLVGSFGSQFFQIAWLLNVLRRSPKELSEPWCFDLSTGLSCNTRDSGHMCREIYERVRGPCGTRCVDTCKDLCSAARGSK
mmetsp:Transcript_65226/g.167878  ORF Transcript_65226/g.167878 Transcript_65226/m.167878 type:complete len:453 (-) Transcript_65226:167-1525(-)